MMSSLILKKRITNHWEGTKAVQIMFKKYIVNSETDIKQASEVRPVQAYALKLLGRCTCLYYDTKTETIRTILSEIEL